MSIYAPLFYKISGYATARYIFYFFISWEKCIAWNKNKYTKSTNKFIDILITRRYQGCLFVFSDPPPLKDLILKYIKSPFYFARTGSGTHATYKILFYVVKDGITEVKL